MKKIQFSTKGKDGQKKKLLSILAALILILALSGTYAWKSYTDWVRNHMQSLGFDSGKVTIVEDFGGDKTPVVPGGTIKKKVDVINSTPVNSFVRVSLEEQIAKLQDGATVSKGFADFTKAGFPTIVDVKDYMVKDSEWKDETAKLFIDGAQANTVDSQLKLFVKGDGENIQSALIRVIDISNKDFPKNFVFTDTKFPIPTLPSKEVDAAAYAADQAFNLGELKDGKTVKAGQKVTGHIKRNKLTGQFEVTTKDTTDKAADINLAYWGYSTTVNDTLVEKDWAGENFAVNVAKTLADPASIEAGGKIKSQLPGGPTINFAQGNIIVGKGSDHTFTKDMENKWFYNTEDGYFYFLSALKSGGQTTASVMESITFPTDNTYNLAAYDLHVGSEAIPAMRAMLKVPSKGGKVEKGDYDKTGKQTVANDSGFGLSDGKLYDFLAGMATIEDEPVK